MLLLNNGLFASRNDGIDGLNHSLRHNRTPICILLGDSHAAASSHPTTQVSAPAKKIRASSRVVSDQKRRTTHAKYLLSYSELYQIPLCVVKCFCLTAQEIMLCDDMLSGSHLAQHLAYGELPLQTIPICECVDVQFCNQSQRPYIFASNRLHSV